MPICQTRFHAAVLADISCNQQGDCGKSAQWGCDACVARVKPQRVDPGSTLSELCSRMGER